MTDRPVLVFQHVDVEHPGSIGVRLMEAGLDLVTVELDRGEAIPELDDFALLLVMGGPMDVWEEDRLPWLVAEKAAVRRWVVDLGRPFLGVCLGHQLLADALGGEVDPMSRPEVGMRKMAVTPEAVGDRLLGDPLPDLWGLQWHGSEVRRPPPAAQVLASTADCAVQAFRVGRCAWGLQFHLEVDLAMLAGWAQIPSYRAALEATYPAGFEALEAGVAERSGSMAQVAATVADRLLDLVG